MGFATAVVGGRVPVSFVYESTRTSLAGLRLQEEEKKKAVNVSIQRCRIVRISAVQAPEKPPAQAVESPVGDERILNKFSCRVTQPKSQGGSQAILYGVGLTYEDLKKPQIGISSVWYEGNTCNMHLLKLSEAVKEGVKEAGMVAFRFNTVGVSDAISMGTEGMCYSLQSRDLIADSIETVMGGQWYDGNISLPGCDKNVSVIA